MTAPTLLEELTFEAQSLMERTPPRWHSRNKRVVFEISTPAGTRHSGTVGYSRWKAGELPARVDVAGAAGRLDSRPDVYDYEPCLGQAGLEWHVNFADPYLFVAYSGQLLAQDELQVLEHPVLGALKESLRAAGIEATTVSLEEGPTPVLVMGAERRCALATNPDASEGRPEGLYGNAFQRASQEAVVRATRVIEPPTVSNVLAMAAPGGGYGKYSEEDIVDVLRTAQAGFHAARLKSVATLGENSAVAVHTGFWGCGAFGGNRVLMAMLQLIAAEMAGLDRLVFHAFNESGVDALGQATRLMGSELDATMDAADLIAALVGMSFEWGVSDGN